MKGGRKTTLATVAHARVAASMARSVIDDASERADLADVCSESARAFDWSRRTNDRDERMIEKNLERNGRADRTFSSEQRLSAFKFMAVLAC